MSYPSIPSPVTTARESHGFRGQGDTEHAADPATRHTPHAALLQRCGRMAVGALLVAQSAFVVYLLGSYGWVRGTVGDLPQHVAISLNALLLVGCAGMAWRAIRRRDVAAHRAWAIRTFVVANGVLFFRLLLALWLVVWRAPVGFDAERFSGPFLTALAFTVYVFGPLCVFEAYRWGERSRSRTVHVGVSLGLVGVALLCLLGAASAMLVLWLPRLS